MATATETQIEIDLEAESQAERLPIEPTEEYEVVNGQIVQEPFLGAYEIWITRRIMRAIDQFNPLRALGESYEEALFILVKSPRVRRRPDIAFVSSERWPVDLPAPRETAWDVIPDLAIEIISPTDLIRDIMDKIDEYFRAGVRAVWVVHPIHELIYNYDSTTSVKILGRGDSLDGGAGLPGFRVAVAELFGDAKKDEPMPEA